MSGSDYSSWKVADLKAALKTKVIARLGICQRMLLFVGVFSPRTCNVRT